MWISHRVLGRVAWETTLPTPTADEPTPSPQTEPKKGENYHFPHWVLSPVSLPPCRSLPWPTAAPHPLPKPPHQLRHLLSADLGVLRTKFAISSSLKLYIMYSPLREKPCATSQLQELQGYAGTPKYHEMPKSHSIWQCHHISSNCQTLFLGVTDIEDSLT